ncbi:MAG: CARDB domain-containing protein [Haloarculaceae archaeon]
MGEPSRRSERTDDGVSRRLLLRGMGTTGMIGALAGCAGVMDREYEATPGTVPADTAEDHGLEEPETRTQEGRVTQGVVVGDIEAELTSHTTTYTRTEDPVEETAEFAVRNLQVPSAVLAGAEFTMAAVVQNTGDSAGETEVDLVSTKGEPFDYDAKVVSLEGGESTTVALTVETGPGDAGEYTVTLRAGDGSVTGEITVEQPPDDDATSPPDEPPRVGVESDDRVDLAFGPGLAPSNDTESDEPTFTAGEPGLARLGPETGRTGRVSLTSPPDASFLRPDALGTDVYGAFVPEDGLLGENEELRFTGPNGAHVSIGQNQAVLVAGDEDGLLLGPIDYSGELVGTIDYSGEIEQWADGHQPIRLTGERNTVRVGIHLSFNNLTLSSFEDQRIKQAENGDLYVTVTDVALGDGGFIGLYDASGETFPGDDNSPQTGPPGQAVGITVEGEPELPLIGVSEYIDPDVVVDANIVLDDVSGLEEDATHRMVAIPHEESNGDLGSVYPAAGDRDVALASLAHVYFGGIEPVEPDTFSIHSTPNPEFVGQNLNPAATGDIEELIREYPRTFERACNCELQQPDEIEVRRVDPAETTLRRNDVGRTVFHLEKGALPDVPETTTLLGDEVPIEFFLIPSWPPRSGSRRGADEGGADEVQTEMVSLDLTGTAKTTGQLDPGTQEAVIVVFTSRNHGFFSPDTALTSFLSGAESDGTRDIAEAANTVDGVCPSITGGTAAETSTPTPTPSPTPAATPPRDLLDEYLGLVEGVGAAASELRQVNRTAIGHMSAAETELLRLDSVAEVAALSEDDLLGEVLLADFDPGSVSDRDLAEISFDDRPFDVSSLETEVDVFAAALERSDQLEAALADRTDDLEDWMSRNHGFFNTHATTKVGPVAPFWEEPTALINTIPAVTASPLVNIAPEPTPIGPDGGACTSECIGAEMRVVVGHGSSYNPFGHAWIEVVMEYRVTCAGPGFETTSYTYTDSWSRGHYGNKTVKDESGNSVVCIPAREQISCSTARSIKGSVSPFSSGYNLLTRNCLDWAAKQLERVNRSKGRAVDGDAGWVSKPCQLCSNWTC